MSPPIASTCLRCGKPLGSGAAGDICPRCEFASVLEPSASPAPSTDLAESRRFGDYELLEEIAHGGMGVVYRARHVKLDRVVALKMLLLGQFSSDLAVKRFQREAAAAAALRHPGIVSVFEVGEAEGQHYFTMELVEGRSLASLLQGGPLPARAAAVYLRALAEAVAHAHAQGIVHRDLKPSNILIDLFDAPRVTDFGLARRLDGSGDLTFTGHIVGSPNYIAPELLGGNSHRPDAEPDPDPTPPHGSSPDASATLGDLFSLGAVLYETLTGRAPFLGATLEETLLRVRDTDPVPPRVLQPRIPRDLETICLKCLEKDPARRYSGAAEFAAELGRFLGGHPIAARPITPLGKAWRWARRKPALASLAVALHLVALLGLSGILWQWRRAEAESDRAGRSALAARNNLVRQWVATGNEFGGQGRIIDALPWYLAALRNEPDPERLDTHRRRLTTALRTAPRAEHVWFHSNRVNVVTFSPDERWVASASDDATARVWSLETGESISPPLFHDEAVRGARFSPDGRRLLTFSSQRLHHPGLGHEAGRGSVRLWSLPDGRPLWSFLHSNTIHSAEFSPDGRRILSACTDGRVRVWRQREDAGPDGIVLEHEFLHPDEARSAAFSPDGLRVATGARDGMYRLWDLTTGRRLHELEGPPTGVSRRPWDRRWVVVFSPDGTRLAGYQDYAARVWDTASGRSLFDLAFNREVNNLAWHPDGSAIATATHEGLAEVWSATNGVRRSLIRTVPFFTSVDETARVEFGPGGETLLVSNRNGLKFFPASDAMPMPPFLPARDIRQARLSRDRRRVLLGGADGQVGVWNLVHSGTVDRTLELGSVGNSVRFSPDGRRVAVGDLASTVGLWDTRTGRSLLHLPHQQSPGNWGVDQLLTSPDGKTLLAADHGGTFGLYSFADGTPLSALWTNSPGHRVHAAFLPDGRHVVTGDFDGVLRLFRISDRACLRSVTNSLHLPITEVLVTRDGRQLITLVNDRTARRWDPLTLEPRGEPMALGGPAHMGALSPDQRTLLTLCSSEGRPRVWDLETDQLIRTLDHPTGVQVGGFSPDGRWIAVCGFFGGVGIWDARTGAKIHQLLTQGMMHCLAFSPDSRWLAAAGDQGTRIWELASGEAVSPILQNSNDMPFNNALDWSPDATLLAGAGGFGRVRLWDFRPAPWTDDDWTLLVVALTGTRLDSLGRLSPVPTAEFADLRAEAKRRFPSEFSPGPELDAEFLWLDGRYQKDSGVRQALHRRLDLAVAVDPPDSPASGRSEARHRRAMLRLHSGDLVGAAEDKPALGNLRRDPACTPHQIDLERACNRGLGPWGFGIPGLHLGDLAPGLHDFGGVRFDVRGIASTDGDNPDRGGSPRRVDAVAVGVRGAFLHVLQGANFDSPDGTPIGDIVLHYVDGVEHRIPVIYGRDSRNWWTVPGESADTPEARVVWRGNCPASTEDSKSLRLYLRSFPNPRPDVEVRSLDLVSAMNCAGFFVVGMTLQ